MLKKEELPIIAEDLGFLTPSVIRLVKKTGYPGMKILQFAFDAGSDSEYLPHNYDKNCVVYTGTHDNSTLREWYQELIVPARRKLRRVLKKQGIKNGSVQDRLLEYTWKSKAEYAIVPLSDILGMGKEARLNTPGTVGSPNWEWRMPDGDRIEAGLKKYAGHLRERK